MQATLITLDEANLHLRLDLIGADESPPYGSDERTPDVEAKMIEAEQIVLDYLKYQDTGWTADTVPRPIKASILQMLAALYGSRGDETERPKQTPGDLLQPGGTVNLLLARLRDPACA
jgi:hypothetical protein